jgi:hypothetical protein
MNKRIKLGLAAILLAGCATRVDYNLAAPEIVQSATLVKQTKFDKDPVTIGPELAYQKTGMEPITIRYQLAFQKNLHALAINASYASSTWRFYESASLEGGDKPTFRLGDRRITNWPF